MNSHTRTLWAAALALCVLLLAILACAANAVNMTVQGTPKYICPSSTPRPTNTMPPPDPPSYPPSFSANLDYYYVDPNRSTVRVQYLAQNVGWVQIGYWGMYSSGLTWPGSSGLQYVAYAGPWPGFSSSYPIVIPLDVSSATIAVYSGGGGASFSVVRYASPVSSSPSYPPCCLPGPVYPTPRPTYTPYPTPTLFQMAAPDSFFLDDPVYNYQGPVQLRLRMKSPIVHGSFPIFPIFTAATWNPWRLPTSGESSSTSSVGCKLTSVKSIGTVRSGPGCGVHRTRRRCFWALSSRRTIHARSCPVRPSR
jgi:hypothetical protein